MWRLSDSSPSELSERVSVLEGRVDELETALDREQDLTERLVDVLEERAAGYDLPEDTLRGFR